MSRSIAKKLLKEYERIRTIEIKDDLIAVEQLRAVQIATLKQLAAAYDAIEGWKYTTYIPGLSRYMGIQVKRPKSVSGFQKLVRRLKNSKQDYVIKIPFNDEYLVKDPRDDEPIRSKQILH